MSESLGIMPATKNGTATSNLTLRPLADRIIVRRNEAQTKIGNIHLPDDVVAKAKPTRGVVLAVGPGKRRMNGNVLPPRVKAGDLVVFSKYSGADMDDPKFPNVVIIKEEDLMAVVEGE